MRLRTRLTERLGIEHPILLAPMGVMSGGPLAAAVSIAGGLGIIGGGYAMPTGLSSNSQPLEMRASAAASSPGRWREIRNYSNRCWPSSQRR